MKLIVFKIVSSGPIFGIFLFPKGLWSSEWFEIIMCFPKFILEKKIQIRKFLVLLKSFFIILGICYTIYYFWQTD
jgi:hypothetical protein